MESKHGSGLSCELEAAGLDDTHKLFECAACRRCVPFDEKTVDPLVSCVSRAREHLDERKPVHRKVSGTAELHYGTRHAQAGCLRWAENELS